MKISKIFHSLYAFLMFLPVCAVLGTTLYSILNPNAKDSYSGSVSRQEYQQVVNQRPSAFDNGDFIIENYYNAKDFTFDVLDTTPYLTVGSSLYLSFKLIQGELVVSDYDDRYIDEAFDIAGISVNNPYLELYIDGGGEFVSIGLVLSYLDAFDNFVNRTLYSGPDTLLDFSNDCVVYLSSFSSSDNHAYALGLDNKWTTGVSYISYDLVEVEETTLDNAFSYSVNSLYLNPLFSWCNNSFLTEPFHYIGDLFGLPRDNAINTLFSYWLNISIIWLCFDVIMYVPLLCHRWIDKGGLE